MILSIINNINKSKKFKGSFSERLLIFFTILRLQLKRKLVRSNKSVVSEHILNYSFYGYNYSTIEFLFNEIFISNIYHFNSNNQQPLIIDCGANIGMSMLYFKRLFPKSKIIAFEANPHAFKLLEKNLNLNNLENVHLYNVALFNEATEISFYLGEDVGSLLGSINANRGGEFELKVKAQRLSYFLNNIEKVDLVKMDVEGAELYIVSDLFESKTINKVNQYIIEYHHNINDDKSILSSFLQKFELNGFNYNIKANFESINTFQDILIHFYKQ
jgi:FkbM family methyltransferase